MTARPAKAAKRKHARPRSADRGSRRARLRQRDGAADSRGRERRRADARRGGLGNIREQHRCHRRANSCPAQRTRALRAVGRHFQIGVAARRWIIIGRNARPRCCEWRSKRNQGPLRDEEIARLFREIMSACLAQQEPLKVAFLGPEGTFTQAAVLKHFGSSVRALPLPAIDEVFHEVEGGIADFGVVPIENSSEGTVNHTLDMFLTSAPQDLRRGGAAHQSSSDGQDERLRRHQAGLRSPAGAGAVPRLAGRAAPRSRTRRGIQQRRGRAARAR